MHPCILFPRCTSFFTWISVFNNTKGHWKLKLEKKWCYYLRERSELTISTMWCPGWLPSAMLFLYKASYSETPVILWVLFNCCLSNSSVVQTNLTVTHCRRWKAGRGFETRLGYKRVDKRAELSRFAVLNSYTWSWTVSIINTSVPHSQTHTIYTLATTCQATPFATTQWESFR